MSMDTFFRALDQLSRKSWQPLSRQRAVHGLAREPLKLSPEVSRIRPLAHLLPPHQSTTNLMQKQSLIGQCSVHFHTEHTLQMPTQLQIAAILQAPSGSSITLFSATANGSRGPQVNCTLIVTESERMERLDI